MPKTLPLPWVKEQETPADHSSSFLIREKLLRAIGEPTDLLRVQVRHLWDDYYRANVFVGTFTDSRVAHSYFLKATADGEIVSSVPAVKREY